MRIKKLELVGFKSFKDRTVIQFDAGITGIVGPNGCGKSNIVDALVWVMGEMSAKHLRGSSMEDVIFAGADGYSPVGMAEVSLTLENDGGAFPAQYLKHSEIMVTRKLHRSGESEYFINREVARLRDIQEIFMDTGAGSKGFSIIEQGAIGRIITAKPEDRRMLIEEAAGITKFKARKRESSRKLVSTEQNLVRLADIVGELKRQIDSLSRQAQRAERYRGLKREAEDLDLWISSTQFLQLKTQIDAHELQLHEVEDNMQSMETSLSGDSAELSVQQLELANCQTQVADRQNELRELKNKVGNLEREAAELKFEIEQARRNKEMTGSLLQESEMRQNLLSTDMEKIEQSLASLNAAAEELAKSYSLKQEIFENAQARINEVDESLTTQRRELLTVSQAESGLRARVQSLNEARAQVQDRMQEQVLTLQELLEKRSQFEGNRKRAFNELERERQMHLDLQKDLESYSENRATLQASLKERREQVDGFKDELNQVASRLYGLENLAANFEGFEVGVKSVMFWQRTRMENLSAEEKLAQTQPQLQPLSDVVEVPEQYELAMEAALGPSLQALLSDDTELPLSAVSYLKENSSGRSSFLPNAAGGGLQMAVANEQHETPIHEIRTLPGVQVCLADVVRVPEKWTELKKRLIGNVAVVSDIRAAIQARKNSFGWSFVTQEGDLLSHHGVLTGGTKDSADSGVLSRRREIKELASKKEELSAKLALAQTLLKKTEESLKALEAELQAAEQRGTEKEILVAGLKKDLERAELELQNLLGAISRQERDVATITAQLQEREHDLVNMEAKLAEFKEKKSALEIECEELDQELRLSRSGIEDMQEEATRLKVESAAKNQEREGSLRQLEMMKRSRDEILGQLSRMQTETERSHETLTVGQVRQAEVQHQLQAMIHLTEEKELEIKALAENFEQLQQITRGLEKKVSEQNSTRHALESKKNETLLHLEQAKMREGNLIEQIRERYILNLAEIAGRYSEREGDLKEAEAQLRELREKIGRIGDVNLSAIEEYDEVSKRYEFLSQQQQDLIEAKEQLKKVIERINRICSKRFTDTFAQVNERFTKAFPVLFGGGEANLILVEDLEKGEQGIDIVAKPPGKKLQNVSLLSGGEKALTAVALIFSIFLVKPSPYCLLDEVDAPLDDANVFRFNDLVKEMAKRSQIIVVTHNKFTMEVAEKLYGVTMQEKGVSKMVSVNLSQARAVTAQV